MMDEGLMNTTESFEDFTFSSDYNVSDDTYHEEAVEEGGLVGLISSFFEDNGTDPLALFLSNGNATLACDYVFGADPEEHDVIASWLIYALIAPSLAFLVFAVVWGLRRGGTGLPVPLPLEEKGRLGTVVAFATAAVVTMQAVIGEGAFAWRESAPVWAASVASLTLGLAVAQIYWPVFVADRSSSRLLFALGLAYSVILTVVLLLVNMPCTQEMTGGSARTTVILLLKWGPVFLLQIAVVLSLLLRAAGRREEDEHKDFAWQHCRLLFAQRTPEGRERKELLDSVVGNPVKYRNLPRFRFSAIFLSAMTMSGIFVVFSTARMMEGWDLVAAYLENTFAHIYHPLRNGPTLFGVLIVRAKEQGLVNDTMVREIEQWMTSFNTAFLLAIVVTCILGLASLALTMRNYRTHHLLLYRGHYTSLKYKHPSWTPLGMALNGVRFVGIQYGFTVWAWLLQFLTLLAVTWTSTLLWILVFHYSEWSIVRYAAERLGPIFVYVLLLGQLQQLLMQRYFLRRPGPGEPFVLGFRNPRAFANYRYVMAFASAPLGLFACAQRIVRSAVISLWLLPRLDLPVIGGPFVALDPGYPYYASLVRLEAALHHPGLLSAVRILRQAVEVTDHLSEHKANGRVHPSEHNGRAMAMGSLNRARDGRKAKSLVARNRWHLALTLERNPGLRLLRGHQLNSLNEEYPGGAEEEKPTFKQRLHTLCETCIGATEEI